MVNCKWLTTLMLIAFCATAHAQDTHLLLEDEHHLDSCRRGELRLNIHNIDFFRDNEYKGKLTDGYTLPGFRLLPTISYQPLRNLKLEVGAYMLHYWGANKYPNFNYSDMPTWKGEQTQEGFHILPFLRAHLALTKNFQVILGGLYGANNHHIIEPLYNPETGLSGDPEMGLQFLWETSFMDFDTWINWESFIFNGDYHQESFTYGLSIRFKANSRASHIHLYFPVQALAQHRGGEINTEAEEREVKTWVNGAVGAGIAISTDGNLLSKIIIETHGAIYKQQSGSMLPFDDGYGFYAKAAADLWRFNLGASYWWCKDFITIHGNPLYGAMSISEEDLTLNKPSLIKLHVNYEQSIGKGITFGANAELYNNFACDGYSDELGFERQSNAISVSFGVYLRIDASFLLKR